MKAKQSGSFKPVPLPEPQTTVARCYSIVHYGTVPNIYQGKLLGDVEKIYINWELPNHKAIFNEERGPEPFVVGTEVTLSTNENSNLAKLIAQWRGRPLSKEEQKEFDPAIMIGKSCLINFTHKTKKKFANEKIKEITNENTVLDFNSIMQKPKEMECPPAINPPYVWDWEPIKDGKAAFDAEKFLKMPKWQQERVKTSKEFAKYGAQHIKSEPNAVTDDDEPATEAPPAPPVSSDGW